MNAWVNGLCFVVASTALTMIAWAVAGRMAQRRPVADEQPDAQRVREDFDRF